jgi:hypothetical protein
LSAIVGVALSLALGASAVAAATPVSAAGAQPAQTVAAAALPKKVDACSGAWVVVDTGKAATVRCAKKYSNGLEALKSAGFAVKATDGFLNQINGSPAQYTTWPYDWWSVWTVKRADNGKWGAWAISDKGAADIKAGQTLAIGFRLLAADTPYPTPSSYAPSVKPPKAYAKAPTPKISGSAKVGQTLTAKTAFSPKPKYAYKWLRGGKAIAGATKATYKLTSQDAGRRITVQVTAKKSGYETVTVKSKASAKVKK